MESTVKVKICGITSVREAEYLNECRADYAGFVCCEKSRRYVTPAQGAEVKKYLSPEIKAVAVTVSPSVRLLEEIEKRGFDVIQIHGRIGTEILEKAQIPIWQAVNVTGEEPVSFLFHETISGYVADGAAPGSGRVFDWCRAEEIKKICGVKPLILAGGLNAENVVPGIRQWRPAVVDVSSGVEGAKGKSREKIEEFVRRIRENG